MCKKNLILFIILILLLTIFLFGTPSPLYAIECTDYAYQKRPDLAEHRPLGNARYWADSAEDLHFPVNHDPAAGDIAVFQPGDHQADATNGHVAYVEKANSDGSFDISEVNVPKGNTNVNTRHINRVLPNDKFIHRKPDLVVKDIKFFKPGTTTEITTKAGQTVTIYAVLENNGGYRTNSFMVKLFLDGKEIGYGTNSTLEPNTRATENVRYSWQAVEGLHNLNFVADCDKTVYESEENNNSFQKEFNIQKATFIDKILNVFQTIVDFFKGINIFSPPEVYSSEESQQYMQQTAPEGSFSIETDTITKESPSESDIVDDVDKEYICKIAFTSNCDGNFEIYTMNTDGSNQRRITDHYADDWYPAWSPDGKLIAFTSNREKNTEIFVINQDGSEVMNLTNNEASDLNPDWSPDGSMIAFESNRDGISDIFIMKRDGSDVINLTNNEAFNKYPNWSPDGNRILFLSDLNGNRGIYSMNKDGSNLINILNNDEIDFYSACPAWSPDGTKIAINSDQNGGYDIYTMNKNGSNLVNLTNIEYSPFTSRVPDGGPDWSPSGNEIVFESSMDGDWDIYIMTKDGNEVINLTNNNIAEDGYPAYSLEFSTMVETTKDIVKIKDSYSIGDIGPAGGFIFYINPNHKTDGWQYLEAAPFDQSSGIIWNNGFNIETGATATGIGAGRNNTQTIVNIQGEGIYAAQLCNDLVYGGYSDWFLPSKDELDLMRINLKNAGIGDFSYFYWSSSECVWPSPKGVAEYAWEQYFHDGSHGIADKEIKRTRVRAARAF